MYLQNNITNLQKAFEAHPKKLESFTKTLDAADQFLSSTSFAIDNKPLNKYFGGTMAVQVRDSKIGTFQFVEQEAAVSSDEYEVLKDAIAKTNTSKVEAQAARKQKFDVFKKVPAKFEKIHTAIKEAQKVVEESLVNSNDCLTALNIDMTQNAKIEASIKKQVSECMQKYTENMDTANSELNHLMNQAGSSLNKAMGGQKTASSKQAEAEALAAKTKAFANCAESAAATEKAYKAAIKQHVETCEKVQGKLVQDLQGLDVARNSINNDIASAATTYAIGKFEYSDVLSYYMATSMNLMGLETVNKYVVATQMQNKQQIQMSKTQAAITKEVFDNILEMKQNIDYKEITGSKDVVPALKQADYMLPYGQYRDSLVQSTKDHFVEIKQEISAAIPNGTLGMSPTLVTQQLTDALNEHCPSAWAKFTGFFSFFTDTVEYPTEAQLYCSFKDVLHVVPAPVHDEA